MKVESVPRSFRRDSRLFLWVALLLILFVNLVTLRLLASATGNFDHCWV